MKKKIIRGIIIGAVILFFLIKGFQWEKVGLFSDEVTTEEDYVDTYSRAEDGRRYTYSSGHSRIRPDKIDFYVKGTLSKGSVEFVFFDGKTGEEYVKKLFSERGQVDFLESIKESTQDIELTIYFSDDAVFVGESGVNMYAHGYKTWFKAY